MVQKGGQKKGTPKAHNANRKKIPIDWDKVDLMLEAGCLGTEVAGEFKCSADTLYNRCEEDKGVLFSDYRRQKTSRGDGRLRVSQYKKALRGDNTMMVWLGKNRLMQKENPEALQEFNGKLIEVLDFLKAIQKESDFSTKPLDKITEK